MPERINGGKRVTGATRGEHRSVGTWHLVVQSHGKRQVARKGAVPMRDAITNPLTPTAEEVGRLLVKEEAQRTRRQPTSTEFDQRAVEQLVNEGGFESPVEDE